MREAAEYGGYLAAEVLGIPHAVVRTDSGSSSYADRGHVADVLDEVRAELGLPPDPAGDGPFRHLLLSFAPPGLDDEPPAPTCVQLRPPTADRAGGAAGVVRPRRRHHDPSSTPRSAPSTTAPSCSATIVDGLAVRTARSSS